MRLFSPLRLCFRTYVCQDIIRRILEDVFGHQIFYCMGVTDVDDKIITRARARWGSTQVPIGG